MILGDLLGTRLVNDLAEAADEKMLAKSIARYSRDLLCIDELGFMELDRRGAELLFQVLTESEEKNSFQRVILRLDQNLHGPPRVRRDH